MGYGDELMAAGRAKVYAETSKHDVLIVGLNDVARWSPLWEGLSYIVRPENRNRRSGFIRMIDGPGCRPYVEYQLMGPDPKKAECFYWKPFRPSPADIVFTTHEAPALTRRGYIAVEPHTKNRGAADNKDWGFERYQSAVNLLRASGFRIVQPDYGKPILQDVDPIKTSDFRDAMRLLRDADAYVGPEGGLHHAAAGLGIPAVVIFTGFISPAVTGYDTHRNLYAGGDPCGSRRPCGHCAEAKASITPEMVAHAVTELDLPKAF